MASPDDDWEPPSDAELKIIEARQERSNKISKLMSEYMLKGYRMLDKLCAQCGTIMLQSREGDNYCVTCNELTSETDKDDPAVSHEAAKVAVKEQYSSSKVKEEETNVKTTTPKTTRLQSRISQYQNVELGDGDLQGTVVHSPQKQIPTTSGITQQQHFNIQQPTPQPLYINYQGIDYTANVIGNKLSWATLELQKTNSAEACIQYCNTIKACSEALLALNNIKKWQS